MIRGQVHDPRAFRLGGIAGHAGVFSTAQDLARFARMLLSRGKLDGARILPASAVDQLTTPHVIGDSVRALGWDMRTRYSGLRGDRLSAHAFGHGGFTGTSLWIDPDQDLTPWLDGPALASALSQRSLPGVKFEPFAITPRSDRWRGQLCSGVLLELTDRRAFRPVPTGLSIASEILRQAPGKFHAEEIGPLVAEPHVVRALAQGTSPAELERLWELDLQRFEAIRRRYLRYPYCE